MCLCVLTVPETRGISRIISIAVSAERKSKLRFILFPPRLTPLLLFASLFRYWLHLSAVHFSCLLLVLLFPCSLLCILIFIFLFPFSLPRSLLLAFSSLRLLFILLTIVLCSKEHWAKDNCNVRFGHLVHIGPLRECCKKRLPKQEQE